MTSITSVQTLNHSPSLQEQINSVADDLMASLPEAQQLTAQERRGIIARYTAVLEGNFIYWMTGALLSVRSEPAREIILENLHEEVRDAHPLMLRKFAVCAAAVPTDTDMQVVNRDLTNVRLFVGKLSAVRMVVMMAFFEGFLQRFMAFLAKLAQLQGSAEMEYTDVHGVCDIAHTEGLLRALDMEMKLEPASAGVNLLEGVDLLRTLMQTVVNPARTTSVATA